MSRTKPPPGVPVAVGRRLWITARTRRPPQWATPWKGPLDGYLASVAARGRGGLGNVPLPLCQLFDTQWVWAASGAEGNDCDWVWRAAGDPAAVRGLLAERTRLDHPDDTVTGWTVEDAGDTGDRHLLPGWIVWHLNGLIARPVPVRCGSTLGLIDPAVEPSEIRPPYQRNQPPTMLIDGTLIPRMVIHHTTRKPA